jgi:hypothetical protein
MPQWLAEDGGRFGERLSLLTVAMENFRMIKSVLFW